MMKWVENGQMSRTTACRRGMGKVLCNVGPQPTKRTPMTRRYGCSPDPGEQEISRNRRRRTTEEEKEEEEGQNRGKESEKKRRRENKQKKRVWLLSSLSVRCQ